ncbi:MAG: hypothetical protein K6G61_12250 [Solobacterium sp.]|nr:hypothetical protein [Solobacterium sp.]
MDTYMHVYFEEINPDVLSPAELYAKLNKDFVLLRIPKPKKEKSQMGRH